MTNLEISAFLAICQHGTISKAAENLYISQSALSTRLKTLERELGCTLLLRGKGRHSLTLTKEGSEFLQLCHDYRFLEEKMRNIGNRQQQAQQLRVSTRPSTGAYLLPPVFERFSRMYPQIPLWLKDIASADAIVANASRNASPAAKRRNPKLRKVR